MVVASRAVLWTLDVGKLESKKVGEKLEVHQSNLEYVANVFFEGK